MTETETAALKPKTIARRLQLGWTPEDAHTVPCGVQKGKKGINRTHGGSGTRLYRMWKQMRIRCYCKTNPTFRFYGARGITICPEWDDFSVFRQWALSHGYTDDLSIERRKVNENYCPENCTFIPMTDQSKNTRRAKLLTVDGITKTQNEWAKTIGVDPATLCERIKKYGPEVSIKMGRRTHGTIN